MRSYFLTLSAVLFLGLVAGCATTPSSSVKSPKASPTETGKGDGRHENPVTKSKEVLLPEGEYRLEIESTPNDAMVVVNGIPVGRTPRTIEIAGTKHGFFRDQVSVKVRFISTDAAHQSQTIEEMLTPLDRIPATVKFTPAGATRVARKTS